MDNINVPNVVKVGVFYDGNYINHVSEYYSRNNSSRISLKGVQEFALQEIAKNSDVDVTSCKIIESHVYKGRVTAAISEERDSLYGERVFDDACMYDNITTHYIPLKNAYGKRQQKGLDVLMALDIYEMTLNKKFDVVVLVTSDSSFQPLINKLHGLNAQTYLIGWDLQWPDSADNSQSQVTKTSRKLIESVTRYIPMAGVIETRSNESAVQNIFVKRRSERTEYADDSTESSNNSEYHGRRNWRGRAPISDDTFVEVPEYDENSRTDSFILSIKNNFGFIKYPENNLFFHRNDFIDPTEFDSLQVDDEVSFQISKGKKGEPVAKLIKCLYDEDGVEDSSSTGNYRSDFVGID